MWSYVRFPSKRKRGKQFFYDKFFLCLIVVFSLSAVGIGYATWQDALKLGGTLTTGAIDPVFTEARLGDTGEGWGKGEGNGSGKEIGLIEIIDEGKSLLVRMDNPKHGNYFLTYTIKNRGNLPAEVQLITQTYGDALDLQILQEPEGVIAGEKTVSGRLKISVEKVKEDCVAGFMVQLVCKQAPVL